MRTKTDGTPQTALDFIRDIILTEMELDDNRVNIFNQKFKVPTDDEIFVVVGSNGSPKVLSSRSELQMIDGAYTEVQMVNTQEIVVVDIYSRNMDAMLRKEEILMAINSIYSQSVQEENGFKIARLSAITNLSELEASAMLNRFEVSLLVFSWFSKQKTQAYYDSFTGEVRTENKTIPFTQNTE